MNFHQLSHKICYIFALTLWLHTAYLLAAPMVEDPFKHIDYKAAFDQWAIWEEYKEVLASELLTDLVAEFEDGCHNVTTSNPSCFDCCWKLRQRFWPSWGYQRVSSQVQETKTSTNLNTKLIEAFIKNKKAQGYRPTFDDLKSDAIQFSIMGGVLAATAATFPAGTVDLGTGFGAYSMANNFSHTVNCAVKQYYRLKR